MPSFTVTTQPPNRRLALIREGLGYLGLGTSDTLRSWQFGVETTPMQVKARVLDPPQLVYAGWVVCLLCCCKWPALLIWMRRFLPIQDRSSGPDHAPRWRMGHPRQEIHCRRCRRALGRDRLRQRAGTGARQLWVSILVFISLHADIRTYLVTDVTFRLLSTASPCLRPRTLSPSSPALARSSACASRQ